MNTKVIQKPYRTKYYPKKFFRHDKFEFGEQVSSTTGEIYKKNIQVTIYIPDGTQSDYEPLIGVNFKLGNDGLSLYVQDTGDVVQMLDNVCKYLESLRTECAEILKEQVQKYRITKQVKIEVSQLPSVP